MAPFKLVNENGSIVAKDPETGETQPVSIESLEAVNAGIERTGAVPGDNDTEVIRWSPNGSFDTIQDAIDYLGGRGSGGFVKITRNSAHDQSINNPGEHLAVVGHGLNRGGKLDYTGDGSSSEDHVVTSSYSDAHFRGLTINHQGTGDNDAIHIAVGESRLENMAVDAAPRHGMYISDVRTMVRGAELTGGDVSALHIDGSKNICQEMMFESPHASGPTIVLDGSDAMALRNRIDGFIVESPNDTGLRIGNANHNVVSGTIGQPGNHGAVIDGSQNILDLDVTGATNDALRVSGTKNVIDIQASYGSVVLEAGSEDNSIVGVCQSLTDNGTNNDTSGLVEHS